MMVDLHKKTFHFASRFERVRCVPATCKLSGLCFGKFVGVPVLENCEGQRWSHRISSLARKLPTSVSAYLAFPDLTN